MPSYQDLSKFSMPDNFRGRAKVIVQLWWIVQCTVFAWSPQFLYGFRRSLLRIFGARIGRNVLIRPSVKITYPWNLIVGDFCWIGENCTIYNLDKIIIGENVALAHEVYLNTGSHDYEKVSFDIKKKGIIIEDECWITNDVYIGPGVTVGKGSIIAARSSAFKSIPPGKICAGTPAVPIKDRAVKIT